MKTIVKLLAFAPLLSTLNSQLSTVFAQGTAFTYQGRLNVSGTPATGHYDLQMILYDAPGGGTQWGPILTNTAVAVSNGLFTVTLDFGNQFPGADRWLNISVQTNGGGGFVLLSPRQKLTPAPYSIMASGASNLLGTVPGAQITGVIPQSVLPNFQSNDLYATVGGGAFNFATNQYAAVGGGAENVASGLAATVGGGALNVASNQFATVGGGQLNTASGSYATVDGGVTNLAGGAGSFVGGGGYDGVGFGGNQATGAVSVVVGGMANTAGGIGSFIGGGGYDGFNTIGNTNNAPAATIVGGLGNTIANFANYAFIGGGAYNAVGMSAAGATVGGGEGNTAGAHDATVGGGYQNTANGQYSTIPGGYGNAASGRMSFAAGGNTIVSNDNSFVWGDDSRSIGSQGANSFTVLATGGVYLYTATNGTDVVLDNNGNLNFGATTRQMLNLWSTAYGIGVQNNDEYFRTAGQFGQFYWFSGGSHNNTNGNSGGGTTLMSLSTSGLTVNGTFVSASDRNLKEHFQPVDAAQVLARVAALPISRWNYKADTASRHIGPVAQDFYGAFGVGPDDKHIAVVDEGGVALAAIQGLNQKVEAENAALRAENVELKARLEKLEKLILQPKPN